MTKKSHDRQMRDQAKELAGDNNWNDLTGVWSQATQYFSAAAGIHAQLRDKNLLSYLDPLNAERFTKTIRALSNDIVTMHEELKSLHAQHVDRHGPVIVEEIMEFFTYFENYADFNNRIDSIIRPSLDFVLAELDKAANAMVRAGDPNVKVVDAATGKEIDLKAQASEASEQPVA